MNKNAREKQLLEEAYSRVLGEQSESKAPKGDSFDSEKNYKPSGVDAGSDGSGGRYRRIRINKPGRSKETHGGRGVQDEEDHVRLTKGSTFNVTNVNVPKKDKELIDHYMKKGFKEVKKPSEDNELDLSDLIAAEDAEDINKDEEEDIDVKEGGGTSADEFKEEEKTGYA